MGPVRAGAVAIPRLRAQDHRIDGYFGPMTKEAVRDFQGRYGLPTTGVVDKATWDLLEGTPA